MKITLVIPDSGFLLDSRVFPSLGILKVAAVLEQDGHQVDVLDLSSVPDVDSAVSQHVAMHDTEVYGLTATMPQMPQAARIERLLRDLTPKSRVILGGPHVTLLHASARQGVQRAQAMLDQLHERFDVLGLAAAAERLGRKQPFPEALELPSSDPCRIRTPAQRRISPVTRTPTAHY